MSYIVTGPPWAVLPEEERRLVREAYAQMAERAAAKEKAKAEFDARVRGDLRRTFGGYSPEELLYVLSDGDRLRLLVEEIRAELSAIAERRRQLEELPGRINEARRQAADSRRDAPIQAERHGEGYRQWHLADAAHLERTAEALERELAQFQRIEAREVAK